MELIQYPQEKNDKKIIDKIIALENTVWPQDEEDKIFPSRSNTYLTSFVLMENDIAVCHVGIRKSILYHKEEKYLAYGLSEVVTHPDYQKTGLATQTIKKAIEFITLQQADISIFTCTKEKVSFYTRLGWQAISGACFIGGTKNQPFRSDALNLVTMMMFISHKSKQHRKDFENTDIIFELEEKQLW